METFCIKKNAELGRYAVASCQNLKAGDFISSEYPFAIGPKPFSKCCCLECFVRIDATVSGSRCDNCSWPICNDCKKFNTFLTHKRECEFFKKANCKFYNLKCSNDVCVQLDCIMPLRVLLERKSNPTRWENEVEPMEHHREKRFGSATWKADEQNIVKYLLGPCKLKKLGIEPELIQQVLGILEVNSFEGKTVKGDSIRCLYPKLAVLSHSCTPNVTHSIHPSKLYKFEARATVPIKKGSPLFACYTYSLSGTQERQFHLLEGKFFQCKCQRCLDPTELGTNFSTLKCQKCQTGNVTSSDPLNSKAVWNCDSKTCTFTNSSENITRLINSLQEKVASANSIDSLEYLLANYNKILHSNHFIQVSIKNALIDRYGHVDGYLLPDLSDDFLKRKIKLCQEVLSILNVFESGKSRARALIMHELHEALLLYAKSSYEKGVITNAEKLKQIKIACDLLDDCFEILKWEDESVCITLTLAKNSLKSINALEI